VRAVIRRALDPAHRPSGKLLLWMIPVWSFFLLLAYHLVLEHRLHVYGALPYVVVLVLGTVPAVYLLFRRHRRHVNR